MSINFPKANGQVYEADEVNIIFGYMLEGDLQTIYKLDYESMAVTLNQSDGWCVNYVVNGGFTATNDSRNYIPAAVIAKEYDDADDSSLDATKWTTATVGSGSVVETTYISLSGANHPGEYARLTAKGSGASLDFKTANGSAIFYVTKTQVGGLASIRIANAAGTAVNVISLYSTTPLLYEFYFDVSAETVIYRSKAEGEDFSAWSATTDLSSLDEWYLDFYIVDPNSNLIFNIYGLRYVQGTAATGSVTSTATDHFDSTSEFDKGVFSANKQLQGGTATYSISVDDGSNYTPVLEDYVTTITDVGYQVMCKATVTTTTTKPSYILEMGCKVWE